MANEIKKILVPVDFSEHSVDALKYAASLAQEAKAELVALHVFNDKQEGESIEESSADSMLLYSPYWRLS